MDIKKIHAAADVVVAGWQEALKKRGTPSPCATCKAPGCCTQQVQAYPEEALQIAEAVVAHPERERLEYQLGRWVKKFLELPAEKQLDQGTIWAEKMTCPFLVGRRCSVYAVRPMACRTYIVVEDTSDKCNDADVQSVAFIDTTVLHRPMLESGMRSFLMPLMVSWRLGQRKIGKAAARKALWLQEKWDEEIHRMATANMDKAGAENDGP